MPIYEYQGQHYDIETADPEEARAKIRAHLGQAAPEQKPQPQSAMPAPVEGAGGAAFGVYRPAGRRPESQQDREAAKEMPLQTVRGLATGALGMPSDVLNLPGTVYSAVTGNEPGYQVPLGSEDWNKILPGQVDTPHANLARFAGQALAPVPTIKGAAQLGSATAAGARAVGEGVAAVGQGVADVGRGAFRGMAYPRGTSPESALIPIKETYVPHQQVSEFMAGQRPATSLTEVPTADLINQSPFTRWAYGMAPKNAQGERLVPAGGRLMEGIGENIGSGIRTNPLQGILDIGGLVSGVGPIGSAVKTVPAAASTLLQSGTQFEPGFAAARAAALARESRAGLQSQMPTTMALPAPGPVRPGPPSTMYVNPQAQATTNVAGTEVNYRPPMARSADFGQVRREMSTAQQAMQAAADRIQPVAPAARQPTPEQQAMLDQIRARGAQQDAAQQQKMEAARAADLAAKQARWAAAGVKLPEETSTSTLDVLKSKLTPQTPEQAAAVDAYNALTPKEKAAQTRAKNASKKDITNMMTEDQLKVWNSLKRSESTANLLKQLRESNDPRAKSLADLLEKQGYNNKK